MSVTAKFLSQIAKQLWNEWELRFLLIVSLVLQFCLVYCGNKRRSYQGNHSAAVAISAWIIYLSANSVANLVLSTLLQGNVKLKVRSDLVVFWTPFILWHLGSPPNITAYSLEDNDMWLRQFFGLVIQIGEAVYIQIKFRSTSTLISFLAFPIFIAGVFKAGERVWALRCASQKEIINSLSLDFEKQMDESSTRKGKLGRNVGAGSEVRIVSQAYESFNTFKPLYIDLPVLIEEKEFDQVINLKKYESDKELRQSEKEGFAEEAFTLVGIELSFLYDLLFTKIPIHQHGIKVIFSLHGLCFLSAVSSFIGFSAFVDKKKIKGIDIAISYMLVVGAISLDIYLFIKHAFSKWTIAKFGSVHHNNKLYSRLLARKLRSIKSQRAMKKVAQHDLISYFVEAIESNFVGAIRLIDTGNLLQKHKYTTWEPMDPSLTTFIYDQLLKKCDEYHHLLKQRHQEKDSDLLILSNLLDKDPCDDVFREKGVSLQNDEDWTPDTTDFSRCVFVWHIATNLVYYHDHYDHRRGMVGSYCQISKTLSDYMLYLVLLRPMMLPKGYGEVINKVTYERAKIFFPKEMRQKFSDNKKRFVTVLDCQGLIPLEKGEKNMDVLEKGHLLGKKLQDLVCRELDHEDKWEMISKVWMGMMMKAAIHCSWNEHAQQLRHGGELLTHVSLLMAHLGLSTKIRIFQQEDESCQFPTPDF
ncbi:hypothetical protein REPUB_Repub01dG0239500 [Reevesia pubescens]